MVYESLKQLEAAKKQSQSKPILNATGDFHANCTRIGLCRGANRQFSDGFCVRAPGIGAHETDTKSMVFGGGAFESREPGRLLDRPESGIGSCCHLFHYSVRRGAAAFYPENV